MTETASKETGFAIDSLSIELIGAYGCHMAWMFLLMFNGSQMLYPNLGEHNTWVFVVSLVVFALTLLAYAIFSQKLRHTLFSRKRRARNRFIAALFMALSALLLAVADAYLAAAVPLGVLSGVLSGLGSSLLLISCGISFSMVETPSITAMTALAFATAGILFVLTAFLADISSLLAIVICVVLPLLEAYLLNLCSKKSVDTFSFADISIPVKQEKLARYFVLPLLVLGIAVGNFRYQAVAVMLGQHTITSYGYGIIFACLIGCGVIILFSRTKTWGPNNIVRILIPFTAAGALVALLIGEPSAAPSVVASGFLFFAYVIMEASLWIFLADTTQKLRFSPLLTFGFGRGSLALGTLIATLVFNEGGVLNVGITDNSPLMVCMMLTFIVIGMALLPSTVDLVHIIDMPAATKTAALQQTYPNAIAQIEGGSADASLESEIIQEPQAEPQQPQQPSQKPETLQEEAPEVSQNEEGVPKKAYFKRKCIATANRYLLSRKETEVLFLLAKGHNSAAIQEKLYISAGTANTHMRHIYRKLDVHSQAELIKLVETTELEDD